MRAALVILLLVLLWPTSSRGQAAPAARTWGDWTAWGDQGQGTYLNPVVPGDYSDLDCIRVGDDYYAISSTFQFSPGMVVLHSRDMVNWTSKGHVISDLTQIGAELNWDKMNRYGKGVWAGAIRYHAGKFWVYFGTPDEGYFMSTAPTAAGPWTPLHSVLKEGGWDDCCPFWDEDGQGYFIGTNFKDNYKIHLFQLTPDGRDLVRESDKVIYQSKGSEANKLYKINGYYYHLFSEVKAEGRALMMERVRNIYGPYEPARQLSHAEKQFKEPNQGGLVQTPKGDWYFLTHHGTGDWSGRIMSLLPVTWLDGYPILGEVGPDGIGRMAWSGKKPVLNTPVVTPQSSDEFNDTKLPVQWEWNYQPRPEKWSLTEKKGWLRLHAYQPLEPDNLLKAGNTLTQRTMRTSTNEVIVRLDLRGMADGQRAGLCHFASPHSSSLGVVREGATRKLEFKTGNEATAGPTLMGNSLWLKSTWGLDGKSQYFYSLDGKTYKPFGQPYQMAWGSYRGDRLGLYSYNNKAEAGYVDVDYFRYNYSRPKR
ncbi:glycoside hydrolase 43 family protein [Hymenobacter sp.]|jgi:beta-xylosidase|uniref:glycoside hydrolase family 43 protein n=1 Tax=Hymenobacter sp. TaxID=1898978 RepID=UPI002EDB0D4B